jgi:endonuclease/exonuclease/phosphatase family metal-dependent hydrolase
MAQNLNRFTAKTAGSLPRVLCGDMNSAPGKNEKPYSVLKSNWLDAYETVSAAGKIGRYADYPGTQSGSSKNYYYGIATYTGGHPERRIDHIMTRGECLASSYEVITTTYNYNGKPWYPSDHLAIASVIDF